MCRAIARSGSTRKKGAEKPHGARRVPKKGRLAGDRGRTGRPRAAGVRGDEMGAHTSLAPLYGYSPKGERVQLQVPRNRGRNTTLLASITLGGMGETMAVEGFTNREIFEAYVEEHVLALTLEAGQLVIMDNLFCAHKSARVRN
jgi:hypothetical protein